jgi:hypothetical protein
MRRRAVVLFLQVLPAFCLVGCTGEKVNRPDPVLVTGVVTHNGSPVEGANVIFQPAGHNYAATGRTDATGAFKLTAFEPDDDGAVPGEYKIAITKSEVTVTGGGGSDDSPTTTKEKLLLPIKYARADGSGLVASVKSGDENKFEFKLEGDASKNPAGGLAPRPTVRTGE